MDNSKELRTKIAILMMGVPLAALLFSAYHLWAFANVPIEQGRLLVRDSLARESGFARLAFGFVGIFVLLTSFRQRQKWAWLTLAAMFLFYMFPVFVYPILVPFPGWMALWTGVNEPGLGRATLVSLVFSLSMALGLVLSLNHLFDRNTRIAWGRGSGN